MEFQRRLNRVVLQALTDGLHIDAVLSQQRGMSVAKVVQANRWDAAKRLVTARRPEASAD